MESDAPRSEALLSLGSATLGESGGRALGPTIVAAWAGATVAGPAYTVRCTPGDNLAIHVAVTRAPAGSVLVVDVGDDPAHGYWGEVLTTGAQARGIAGLVIGGGVRDVAALRAHGFGVFSRSVALAGATKNRPGEVGGAVAIDNVVVRTGDWIVGDVDGVVAIEGHRLDEVIEAGRAREQREADMFERLRAGATTVELLDLDASLITDRLPPGEHD